MEITRSILQVRRLSDQFYAEAIATSVYLLNLSPTRRESKFSYADAWQKFNTHRS